MISSRSTVAAAALTAAAAVVAAGVASGPAAAATGAGVPHTARAAAAAAAVAAPAAAAQHRVLFDNTKAETAGNADWVISTSQPDPLAQNANPTSESSWTGALSAWGVALQKTGSYSLKTLPSGNTITYGTSGTLDLKNFDEFVIDEPNIRLSTAEKTAVMTFVQNGGGLFLISDHNGSDRNNDGWDSPAIINDLLTSNGVDNTDPFGFSVDIKDISTDNPRAVTDASNPVLHGSFGTVTGSILRDGTTFTLKPADNAAVKGLLYTTGTTGGNTNAFFVTSAFGQGRVAIWGDSSPVDDGTGSSGNTLYDGWDDPAGTDAALALNATAWLATGSGSTGGGGVTVANPGSRTGTVGTAASLQLSATDTATGTLSWSATGLPSGLSINVSSGLISGTPTVSGSYSVTVTARDSTGPTGSASFTWTIGTGGGGSGCTPAQLLANPGFETGSISPWTQTDSAGGSVLNSGSSEPAHGGTYDAWLDGYGSATTDTLAQSVDAAGRLHELHLHLLDAHRHRRDRHDGVRHAQGAGAELLRHGPVHPGDVLEHQRRRRLHPAQLQPRRLRGAVRHPEVHRGRGLHEADVVRHRRRGGQHQLSLVAVVLGAVLRGGPSLSRLAGARYGGCCRRGCCHRGGCRGGCRRRGCCRRRTLSDWLSRVTILEDTAGAAALPPMVNTPAFKADAHAEYARLRAEGPLHRVRLPNGLVIWLVVSHELAREVLGHPLIAKDPTPALAALDAAGYTSHRVGVGLGGNMLTADPPHHTRLRRLVAGVFTPRRVALLRPHIQRITDDLLDALDALEHLAHRAHSATRRPSTSSTRSPRRCR